MSAQQLPDTHQEAIVWLERRGCEGVIDRFGRLVAQGQRYKSGETAQVWLRLVASGHLISAGPARLKLSREGVAEAKRLRGRFVDEDSEVAFANRKHGRSMVDDADGEFA